MHFGKSVTLEKHFNLVRKTLEHEFSYSDGKTLYKIYASYDESCDILILSAQEVCPGIESKCQRFFYEEFDHKLSWAEITGLTYSVFNEWKSTSSGKETLCTK